MEQSKKKPNFLFLVTHDTGRNIGCYNKLVKTPNIDKLAQNGVRFINNFATAPQCSPSRGSMITGKFPHSNGLMGLVNEGWDLPEKNTIPRILG